MTFSILGYLILIPDRVYNLESTERKSSLLVHDLFDRGVSHSVYSITCCLIELHAPCRIPSVVNIDPQVAQVTLKYLPAIESLATLP